jgi:hypothetical protein
LLNTGGNFAEINKLKYLNNIKNDGMFQIHANYLPAHTIVKSKYFQIELLCPSGYSKDSVECFPNIMLVNIPLATVNTEGDTKKAMLALVTFKTTERLARCGGSRLMRMYSAFLKVMTGLCYSINTTTLPYRYTCTRFWTSVFS